MSGLNQTPSGERTLIAFFGRRNAGKSSLVNAVTGQEMSVVSRVRGTTTDPVRKSMELLPLGPVTIVDTPGLDDEGELGSLRVKKALQVMNRADIAVLVTSVDMPDDPIEKLLVERFRERDIPWIRAVNKADLLDAVPARTDDTIYVSALEGTNIYELKDMIARTARSGGPERPILSDLVGAGDWLVLVVPIDKAAPKGRLILPQQMAIRDALDAGAVVTVARDTELDRALAGLSAPPKLVVTDSQVFSKVSRIVPEDVPLTSFSILMARHKGTLWQSVEGARALGTLRDGDRILISEGCTHHRQCGDIGSQKLPDWIRRYTGAEIAFDLSSGQTFPEDLSAYKLVVHCGGCMLNEREMRFRARQCREQGVPLTNYGTAIACMNGILERSLEPVAPRAGVPARP